MRSHPTIFAISLAFALAVMSAMGTQLLPTAQAKASNSSLPTAIAANPLAAEGTTTPSGLSQPFADVAPHPHGPFPQPSVTDATICPATGALEGVDVSSYDGSVNWTQVAQSKSFAYARVADGSTITDTLFLTNYTGIKSAGMKAGGYLFFQPAQDPTQQARLFVTELTSAGFAQGDLAPVFDVEVTGGQISTTIVSALQTAVTYVENSLNVTPVIYTAPGFWDASVGSAAFSNLPLWTADWTAGCPSVPAGWSNWALWQYADNGSVAGISGPADLDRSNGPTLPLFGSAHKLYLPVIMK